MAIGLTGRLQTGSYTNKDGQKVYTTDVVVDEAEFVESKNASKESGATIKPTNSNDGFLEIPEAIGEDEFPFS